jgi:invasion protein IalB
LRKPDYDKEPLMSRLSLALALTALIATPAFAEDAKPAPVGADPVTTTASYGDWVLRCQRIGEADKAQKVCEIVQTVQAGQQGQQQPVAQLAFGRVNKTDPWRMTAHLPTNILLPSVAKLTTGEKDAKPLELPWRRCVPVGCFADASLSDAQWKALRGETENAVLDFTDSASRAVKLPISFRGFAQAVDALAKE